MLILKIYLQNRNIILIYFKKILKKLIFSYEFVNQLDLTLDTRLRVNKNPTQVVTKIRVDNVTEKKKTQCNEVIVCYFIFFL
jgi:hypothetical protein